MPFINGRYYMNPAYGRALEAAREAEERNLRLARLAAARESDAASTGSAEGNGHWITKDHQHILIADRTHGGRGTQARTDGSFGGDVGFLARIHAGLQDRNKSGVSGSPTERTGQQDDSASNSTRRQQMNYTVSVGGHPDRRLVQPPTPVRVIISPDPPLPPGKYQIQVTLTRQTSDGSNGSSVAAELTAHIDDVTGGSAKIGSQQVPAVANKIPLTIGISARNGDFHYEGHADINVTITGSTGTKSGLSIPSSCKMETQAPHL